MADAIDALLAVARQEIGYLEKSKAAWKEKGVSCLYPKTEYAGSENYTLYGYEMHNIDPKVMDFPAAWCDAFVDWCFVKAFGVDTARAVLNGFDDYTKDSARKFASNGQLKYDSPQRGDVIFFSKDSKLTGVYHTGIVTDVIGNRVYTIEGNTSSAAEVVPNGGAVCAKAYDIGNPRVYAFGRPDYALCAWHWVQDGGKWYYQDAQGRNAHGWKLIKEREGQYSHWYYFDATGAMLTGVQTVTDSGTDQLCLFMPNGPLEGALCKSDDNGYQHVWSL